MGQFGAVINPWDAAEWERSTGIKPDFLATFENWVNGRTLAEQFAKALAIGYRRYFVTWEPWAPDGDRRRQPAYAPEAILRGDHDAYIKSFARAVRDSGLDAVYMRFAHEMQGDWYPWAGNDPALYVEAWIKVRLMFRQQNAFNAKWIWSPNADLYRDRAGWVRSVLPYWPGVTKVDYVGLTTINFGGAKTYPWSRFADRLWTAAYLFERPVLSSEMNSAYTEREKWLRDMASYARDGMPVLDMVCLSQGESYAAATMSTGDLSWSVTDDSTSQGLLRELVTALHSRQ